MMNYFEFYKIKPSFFIDEEYLKKMFYQCSKDFHPDFHALKSEEEQQKMLELSTLNNKSFFVLKSFNTRLEYLLKSKQVLIEDEKYALPPEFLMEMMEINEEIMDLSFEPDANKIDGLKQKTERIENEIEQEIEAKAKEYDEGENEDILLKIKDLWYRKKYLLRIRDSLNKFAI
jgi:molecular chaperone HscB